MLFRINVTAYRYDANIVKIHMNKKEYALSWFYFK